MFYIIMHIVFVYIYTCCIIQLLKHACYVSYVFDDNFGGVFFGCTGSLLLGADFL